MSQLHGAKLSKLPVHVVGDVGRLMKVAAHWLSVHGLGVLVPLLPPRVANGVDTPCTVRLLLLCAQQCSCELALVPQHGVLHRERVLPSHHLKRQAGPAHCCAPQRIGIVVARPKLKVSAQGAVQPDLMVVRVPIETGLDEVRTVGQTGQAVEPSTCVAVRLSVGPVRRLIAACFSYVYARGARQTLYTTVGNMMAWLNNKSSPLKNDLAKVAVCAVLGELCEMHGGAMAPLSGRRESAAELGARPWSRTGLPQERLGAP